MTNNLSENIGDEFIKVNKVGLSMESLNVFFFQFSAKIIKRFVLISELGICH